MAEASNQSGASVTVIGPEAEFRGQLTSRGSARILGVFEGEISSEGEIHIGEGASCRATVQAARIVVDGSLEGDLTASDRVQLGARAQVRGDLVAGALSVSEGASFCGHCTVGPEITTPVAGATGAARPRVETKPVKPASPAPARAGATPARVSATVGVVGVVGAAGAKADSLAAATAELENDPEWQSLAQS